MKDIWQEIVDISHRLKWLYDYLIEYEDKIVSRGLIT